MNARRASSSRIPDEVLDRQIGILLRAGVVSAAAIALLGGALFLARHGSEPATYDVFHGEPQDLRSVGGVFREVLMLRGRAIIQLGLLLLVATPVARVALTLVAYARQRDWRFVGIASLVLALLLFSLSGSP
jgi:uncharacterized membrane protein